jgi:hypothetical protein
MLSGRLARSRSSSDWGRPQDRKRRIVYDSGHNLPLNAMIKETLDWLDRTLGPVKR